MPRRQKTTDSKERWFLPLLCLYAFLFSGYYALTNPPFEAPDEPGHLAYINYVAENKELPNQARPETRVDGEGHQHPLYYVLAAAIPYTSTRTVESSSIPNAESVLAGGTREDVPVHVSVLFGSDGDRTSFYLIRLLSSLFAALAVLLVGLTARLCLRKELQLLPPLFVATLPQFQFIGGSISNDALTTLLAATVTYAAVKAIQLPLTRRWVALGVWIGVAVLVKKSNLIFVPLGLGLPFLLQRDAVAAKRAGLVFVGAALLVVPLLIRNFNLYGDLLGSAMERETLAGLVESKPATYFLKNFPLAVARSFFAEFGWMNVHVPVLLPLLFYALVVPPIWFVRQQAREQNLAGQALFAGLTVALSIVALAFYNLTFTQPQGRLLFPALPALALLWGIGMGKFERWIKPAAVVLVLMDIVCAWVNWSFY